MPTYYVAPTGSDLLNDGSLGAPFKTIAHVLGCDGSSNYTLIDSTTIYLAAGNHEIAANTPIVVSGKQNIIVRSVPGAVAKVTSHAGKVFDFTACPGLVLADFEFASDAAATELIKITNCNLSKLSGLKTTSISLSNGSNTLKCIDLVNTATEISHCSFSGITSSAELQVIAVDNASTANINNCSISACTGTTTYGVIVQPNNLTVTLSQYSCATLGGSSYGVYFDLGGMVTDVLLDNLTISGCTFGVYGKNNVLTHADKVRVRRFEIFSCRYGIVFEACCGSVYNGVMAKSNFGLYARTGSDQIKCYNNIFYQIKDLFSLSSTAAIRASDSSEVDVSYCDFYECSTYFQEASNGSIIRSAYIRFTNPRFTDADNDDYSLIDTSPLVDVGLAPDYEIVGAAADMGKYDIDRLIPTDEIGNLSLKLITRTYRAYDIGQINVQPLITAILKEVDPDIVVREGSSINDLMVKPHGIMYQRLLNTLMMMMRNQSILAADYMTSAELEPFAANYFVTRQAGTLALVTARVYLSQAVNIVISPVDVFTTDAGLRFYPRQYVAMSRNEVLNNLEGQYFFVDVPLEAENLGVAYNITSGQVTGWLGKPDVAVSITNLSDAYPAKDPEDNQGLTDRTRFSIGNRSLVTGIGIRALMGEYYPELSRAVVIGAGDVEMVRDIFHNVHFNGKTDVYVSATDRAESRFDLLNAQAATIFNRTTIGNVPIILVKELRVLDPSTGEPTDIVVPTNKYSISVAVPDDRYSLYESLTLNLDANYQHQNLRITFDWAPQILLVHNYCQDKDNRVVCEDMRVKHLTPVYLSFNVNYKAVLEIDETLTMSDMKDFINNFPPEQEFQVSDLIDMMYQHSADFVEQPVVVTATYYHPTGIVEVKDFENTLTIPRTYGYIAGDISLTNIG